MHDCEGGFVDVNPAWQRVLGWERDQLLGKLVTAFLHPDDVDPAESRYLCADGSYRWLRWSTYPDGDGWCGVGRDVTEKKHAEAARDLAQQQAVEAYETTGLSTWRWELAADHMIFSGMLEETRTALGLPADLESALQLVQPSHRTEVRQVLARVADGSDDSFSLRCPVAVADGSIAWVESRGAVVRAEDGTVEAIQGTTQDVTEAELAGLELVRSRNFNQATLDSLDSHVAVLDENGTIVFVNGGWTRFASANGAPGLGVGESYLDVCDAARASAPEAGPVARALRRMLAGSLSSYEVEYPCHAPDEERWFVMTAVLHRAEGPTRLVVQHQNITQRVQAEHGERLRAGLLDEVDAAVIATDLEGRVTFWSRGAEALYGWTEAEAVGERVANLVVPAHFHDLWDGFVQNLRQSNRWQGDLKLRRKDDSSFIGFVRASVLSGDDGVPVGLVGVSVDATERVTAQDELREAQDYLTTVTDSMGEGLIAIDEAGGILYMNVTAEERLGWTCDELLGRNLHETSHHHRSDGSTYPIEECPLMSAGPGGEVVRVDDDVFFRRDGSPLHISYTVAPFELADGGCGAVIVFADITERKQAEWALRASEAQLKAIIENTSAAIYLKRKGDYRYLLGNPEFERVLGIEPGTAVGLRDEDLYPPEALQKLRKSDRQVIEEGAAISLEEVIPSDGEQRTFLTLKFPLPDEHGEPYALCGISTDITERKRREAALSERLDWEERIRTAVSEDRLLVYAQPIIDLRSGEVVQEELLVRMRGVRGAGDVILPGEFLPQAERFGLIGQIDRFMVQRGIELAAEGRSVQINLSGRSISDRALTREIERELRSTGADPAKIIFEITETAAVEDIQAAREFSQRIRRIGCRCALDDFGTGYGSLTYQRHLVVQYLKIDISFVSGMVGSRSDQQVVKSIIKLAEGYGQQTIAEGVEDEQTLQLLRQFGVDYAQGYHIGRPVPVIRS